jgi:BirA family biotin operon repressor/biotin-[acetyl-CoA-carboxylase] ligase
MSVVLRLKLEASHAPRITQAAAVGVAKALWEIGVEARIKWPNDLLVDGKKICGILAESSTGRSTLSPGGMSREPDPAILGIGLNANLDPEDLKVPAREVTTIRAELGHDIDLANVLNRILNNLHAELSRLDEFAAILQDWRALNCTLGERVCVQRSGQSLEGRAIDLTPEGALMLETTRGVVEIFEGEIERIHQSQSS